MAKLEEISQMLVSEIRDFEEAVKKLEEIQKAKITIDIAELKQVLSNHEVKLKDQFLAVQQVQKQFENSLKDAKIYPKWAVVVLVIFLILNCLVIIILFDIYGF